MVRPQFKMRQTTHFGLGAILAIFAAVASIVCSALGKWGWGLGLGFASLPLGLSGFVQSGSPRKRSGFPTLAAVLLGIAGCAFAVVMFVLHLLKR